MMRLNVDRVMERDKALLELSNRAGIRSYICKCLDDFSQVGNICLVGPTFSILTCLPVPCQTIKTGKFSWAVQPEKSEMIAN